MPNAPTRSTTGGVSAADAQKQALEEARKRAASNPERYAQASRLGAEAVRFIEQLQKDVGTW